jgi:hypothetical protein
MDIKSLSDADLLAILGQSPAQPPAPASAPAMPDLSGMSDADLLAVFKPSPNMGFASRAAREGDDASLRRSEFLADAVRNRVQNPATGMLDAAVRGAAGWIPGMDKIAAAGDAAIGRGQGETFSDRYSTNLERERARDEADRLMNPSARLGGQAVGLVGTAMALPTLTVAQGAGRGATAINSALTGATYGGVTGLVENDGTVGEKIGAAAQSAAIGGALGAIAPTAVEGAVRGASAVAGGVGAVMRPVTETIRSTINPQAAAMRRIEQAFDADGVANPAAALRSMQAAGAPAVAADVGGENVRALARSSANLSPEARSGFVDVTSERFATQGERLTDTLKSLGPTAAGKTLDDLQAAAKAANKPAYLQAYQDGEGGMWNETLSGLARAPAVQDTFKAVIKTGANRTVADGLPPIKTPFALDEMGNLIIKRQPDGSVATPNLAFWDEVQRKLRSQANVASRTGDDATARDLGNLRRLIVNELDTQVPSFKDARQGAARFFQAEDALEAGEKFVTSRMANNEALKALAKMKPQERELFAEGFRSQLVAKIQETGDSRDVVKALFNSPAARQRVEIALGARQAREFEARIKTEEAMNALRTALGNSTTARQLAELGMASAAGGGIGYWQGGNPMSAFAGAAVGAALRTGKANASAKLADQVGKILVSGDPVKIESVARAAAKNKAVLSAIEALSDTAQQGAAKVMAVNPPITSSQLPAIPMIAGPRMAPAEEERSNR